MNLSNLMRLGSSRTKQETCKTCLNPGQTVVAVSLVLYHYKKTLADGTENLGISQLKTALPLYSGRQLVELVCLVAIWELFFFFFLDIFGSLIYTQSFSNPVPTFNVFCLAHMIPCLV